MNKTKVWVHAFRLRTLPLSFSSILSGAAFAWLHASFNHTSILYLALLTTLFLQVLSNLANDYGDSKNGVDNHHRIGPERAVQSGVISLSAMRIAIVVFSVLSLTSGVALVLTAFSNDELPWIALFIAFGLASVWAAIKYTVGNKPYGYRGLGDVFVFLFFGLLGVCGSYFLFTHTLKWDVIVWALFVGCFSTGVLNLNNMRDIANDKASGKITLPVKMGLSTAKKYHFTLIIVGVICMALISVYYQLWTLILVIPFILFHVKAVSKADSAHMDPELKRLALTTFASSIVLCLSVLFYPFLHN